MSSMSAGFPAPTFVRTNGIRMAVHDQGSGLPIVLCHGFPELAFSWRRQIPRLAAAGFRAIAPDQRGYGATEKPSAVEEYDIRHLTDDLVGMLDALGIEKAVFCGHDWGGHVVWEMPILHPERVAGVIGVNTPHRYFRRMGADPAAWLRERLGPRTYRLAFLRHGVEDQFTAEMLPRFFAGLFRARPVTMSQYLSSPPMFRNLELDFLLGMILSDEPAGGELLTADELAVYVQAFGGGGMAGPINWYRNLTRNAEILSGTSDRISVPCLMIAAEDDFFLPPDLVEEMDGWVPDLEKHVIPRCGHWTQIEQPEALNGLVVDWLSRRFGE